MDGRLTAAQIRIILEALRQQHGPGYSDKLEVGQLQAKLSIMLEVAVRREAAEGDRTDG